MNYFQLLPNLVLSTPTPTDSSATLTIKNLFRSIRFRSDMKKYIQFYERYVVLDDEKPSDVSFKFYENPSYDWMILLFNNIRDINSEWPKSEYFLNEHIRTKYLDPYAVHHYETKQVLYNGLELLPAGLEVLSDFTFSTPPEIGGFGFKGTVTEGSPVIEIIGPTTNVQSSGVEVFNNVIPGYPLFCPTSIFPDGTEIVNCERNVDGVYYVTVDQDALTSQYYDAFSTSRYGPKVLKGDNVLNRVTNYEYESKLNESKRLISILSPSLLRTVEEEFRNKLAYQEFTEYTPPDQEYSLDQKLSNFY